MSGIRTGPLFPRTFQKKKKTAIMMAHSYWVDPTKNIKYWKDIDGNLIGLQYGTLNAMFGKVFAKAGYKGPDFKGAELYSIRKSATKWAARCGAQQYQVVAAGRWENNSRHFMSYIEQGDLEGKSASDDPEDDPIRKIWVFYPTAVQSSVESESVVS